MTFITYQCHDTCTIFLSDQLFKKYQSNLKSQVIMHHLTLPGIDLYIYRLLKLKYRSLSLLDFFLIEKEVHHNQLYRADGWVGVCLVFLNLKFRNQMKNWAPSINECPEPLEYQLCSAQSAITISELLLGFLKWGGRD